MNPWDQKREIEQCCELVEQFGFKIKRGAYGNYDAISLESADDNPVWAKKVILESFDSWNDLKMFLAGYAKCMLYHDAKGKK